MDKNYAEIIARELSLTEGQVKATIRLLEEGATIPFISRYRKEVTGSLDEVAVGAIRDRNEQLQELDKRREAILKSMKEQNVLTPELEKKVNAAATMAVLEDIYLPYKPKRRTRATIAKEKGLEPLATLIFEQQLKEVSGEASKFIDAEKGVANSDEALAGARDIIAEWVNENGEARSKVRDLFFRQGIIKSTVIPGKETEGQKYKDYFEWQEPISKCPSHRLLAMRRGEKEMILSLEITPEDEDAVEILNRQFVTGRGEAAEQVQLAVKDSYKRLLKPSMETEVRMGTKTKADEEAIRVFAANAKQLLMAPPLGQKNVLSIDPGFRTGCKVVCLDRQGKLLHYEAIFPHEPQREFAKASAVIAALCQRFEVEAIAIGNGTASRETEAFVKKIGLPSSIAVVVVNESGASIYSASEVARAEFPDYDVTVRGAVSIGRRLMDPLAELVKIDPKSIGVGQYQHDVDQNALKNMLTDTVMSCVNAVGVEVNTASKEILTYISGLGPQLAQNIIDYRNQNGPFKSREALKKVPRMGDKAFEQAAGFLRLRESANPLDSSSVHPESYHIVEKMAKDAGVDIKDLMKKGDARKQIDVRKYVTEKVGLPTLQDIMQELEKPGRDPREQFEAFAFMEGVEKMEDLRTGMKLPGIVTNITKFGVFVDIGVHQDGLIHISHLADRFISDPAEVVKVHQKVEVTVLEVDVPRKRISLSMKGNTAPVAKSEKAAGKTEKKGGKENDMQSKLAELKSKFSR
jgi:protein Tex